MTDDQSQASAIFFVSNLDIKQSFLWSMWLLSLVKSEIMSLAMTGVGLVTRSFS